VPLKIQDNDLTMRSFEALYDASGRSWAKPAKKTAALDYRLIRDPCFWRLQVGNEEVQPGRAAL
jgi:hypothetical protein